MAMRRQGLARVINLVAPGSGLVLLRREWLGLAVAALFAVLGQVVVLGSGPADAGVGDGIADRGPQASDEVGGLLRVHRRRGDGPHDGASGGVRLGDDLRHRHP